MKRYLLAVLLLTCITTSYSWANYTTPGTGIRWNLDSLVLFSGGDVTFNGTNYVVNDTITVSVNDTIALMNDAVVKFAVSTYWDINGVIIINPPNSVVFTTNDIDTSFHGMRITASNASYLKKFTLEHAISLRLSDCSIVIDSCTFQYNNNNSSTSFGNGAVALFRAHPIITNSTFRNNYRAAIQGGANIANAPQIINCSFLGNNTTNANVPQINLGTTGADTARILNNQIIGGNTNSGGIGFLPIGTVNALIKHNVIKHNRYGVTFNGGANINSITSYNIIDSNNIQGDPNLGGSGISFSGGSATSHQNSIVTGNHFKGNLWGITILGRSQPNLGNINNSDTADDGKNYFVGNTNANQWNIEVYNNSPDNIFAQNNYWGVEHIDSVEARVYHTPDNSALGFVDYSSYIVLPVELTTITAKANGSSVLVEWHTSSENNSDRFEVQRSIDGRLFYSIGSVKATGFTNGSSYQFVDNEVSDQSVIFYRLLLIDKDNTRKYSAVVSVRLKKTKQQHIKVYPTIVSNRQELKAELISGKDQKISMTIIDASGRVVSQFTKEVKQGHNTISFTPGASLLSGMTQIKFIGEGINGTATIIKQ